MHNDKPRHNAIRRKQSSKLLPAIVLQQLLRIPSAIHRTNPTILLLHFSNLQPHSRPGRIPHVRINLVEVRVQYVAGVPITSCDTDRCDCYWALVEEEEEGGGTAGRVGEVGTSGDY